MCGTDSDNALIRDLVESGFAEPHPHGGFRLEPGTLLLKGHRNVYCIGAMSKGEEYYINAVPRLVEQAAEISEDVVQRWQASEV